MSSEIENAIAREEMFQVVRKEEEMIFIEDTGAKQLQILINLKESPYKERLAYAKHLAECLQTIGLDGVPHYKTIFQYMLSDADEVKKALIAQMSGIQQYFKTLTNSYDLMKVHLIGALQELLRSPNFDIKELAGNQVSLLVPELTEQDRGNLVLTQVIQMAHDESCEENVIVAIKLFGQLACMFGQELAESFIALEILSKGEDTRWQVKKEAVLQLANISKALSKEFTKHRLLPFFQRKSEERTWQTRKACVDVIVDLIPICEPEFITQRMLILLDDSNKWVKQAAYKKLGKFIILTGQEKLLDYYMRMHETEVRELGLDNEILIDCSQYFPGVLTIYGEKKWPLLKTIFQKLISHKDRRVKLPLACSIHEIAKILGPQLAFDDLLKPLEQLMQDPDDDIKYGVIQNLGNFFNFIDENKRETLIDIVLIIQKDQKKWRIRELIAKQISNLAKVFSPEIVFQLILPITSKLCNDNVYTVRRKAAKQVYALYNKFKGNEVYSELLNQTILGFARSDMFSQRQRYYDLYHSFVVMCEQLMNYQEFQVDFLEAFVNCAHDQIKNVRISVCKVLHRYLHKNKGILRNHVAIQRIWNTLLQDKYVIQTINLDKYPSSDEPQPVTNQQIHPQDIDSQIQEIEKIQLHQQEIEIEDHNTLDQLAEEQSQSPATVNQQEPNDIPVEQQIVEQQDAVPQEELQQEQQEIANAESDHQNNEQIQPEI